MKTKPHIKMKTPHLKHMIAALPILAALLVCAGTARAQLLTPSGLSWSSVDLGNMTGSIRSVSGDSLSNLYLANTNNQIWQLDNATETWERRTDFDAWLANSALSPNMTAVAPRSMSAAGGYIFIGGGGSDSRQRIAVYNGTSWAEVNTGGGSDNFQSKSYVMTEADGTAQVGDVVTIFGRGTGRIFRMVNGVSAQGTGSTRTPADAADHRGVAVLPDSNLAWTAGSTTNVPATGMVAESTGSGRSGTWSMTTGDVGNRAGNVIHALDANTLIVGTLSTGGTYSEVQLTLNGGDSWSRISPFSGTHFTQNVNSLWADATNNIYIGLAGHGVWHYAGVGTGNSSVWTQLTQIGATDSIFTMHELDGQLWFGGNDILGDPVLYSAVPEPSTYAMLVLAGLGLALHAARRRRRLPH
jgi:hypothetical protein